MRSKFNPRVRARVNPRLRLRLRVRGEMSDRWHIYEFKV